MKFSTLRTVMTVVCLLSASIAVLPPVAAEEGDFYAGGSLGESRSKINNTGLNNILLPLGATGVETNGQDETDTGFKLFLGYRFNPTVSFELGYFELGRARLDTNAIVGASSGSLLTDIKNKNGLNFDLVLTAPITETWSVIGRLGIQRSRTDANSSAITVGGRALGIQSSDSAVSAKFGLGVQYDFTPRMGLRGEWERYRVPDSIGGKMDWDLYSVGGILRF